MPPNQAAIDTNKQTSLGNNSNDLSLPPTAKDVAQEKSYWNSFYSKFALAIPSQFCVLTATEVKKSDKPIVEFGCGNGRDSIYFASQGFDVFACDLSKEAIDYNKAKADTFNNDSTHPGSIEFEPLDATNGYEVKSIINKARAKGVTKNVVVYTRFFLHSIDENQEELLLSALSGALVEGDEIHSEYRSQEDEALPKAFGKGHYRRYIDTPALLQKLQSKGFETIYEITGRGMAKYKNEDPFVSRFIVRKM